MKTHCIICKTVKDDQKLDGSDISYHRIPKEAAAREKWNRVLSEGGCPLPIKIDYSAHRLCSLHFSHSDLCVRRYRSSKQPRYMLKRNAVPCYRLRPINAETQQESRIGEKRSIETDSDEEPRLVVDLEADENNTELDKKASFLNVRSNKQLFEPQVVNELVGKIQSAFNEVNNTTLPTSAESQEPINWWSQLTPTVPTGYPPCQTTWTPTTSAWCPPTTSAWSEGAVITTSGGNDHKQYHGNNNAHEWLYSNVDQWGNAVPQPYQAAATSNPGVPMNQWGGDVSSNWNQQNQQAAQWDGIVKIKQEVNEWIVPETASENWYNESQCTEQQETNVQLPSVSELLMSTKPDQHKGEADATSNEFQFPDNKAPETGGSGCANFWALYSNYNNEQEQVIGVSEKPQVTVPQRENLHEFIEDDMLFPELAKKYFRLSQDALKKNMLDIKEAEKRERKRSKRCKEHLHTNTILQEKNAKSQHLLHNTGRRHNPSVTNNYDWKLQPYHAPAHSAYAPRWNPYVTPSNCNSLQDYPGRTTMPNMFSPVLPAQSPNGPTDVSLVDRRPYMPQSYKVPH